MVKIVTLCGCGLGTCFILKFTAEQALRELGMNAEVVPCGIESGSVESADLYLVPYGLKFDPGPDGGERVAAIRNVLSAQEIKNVIASHFGTGKMERE